MLRKRILAGLFLIAWVIAQAAGTTANLSWTLPVAYIDGSTLPASAIASTTVEWRRTASGAVVGSVTVVTPAITATVPNLVCGGFVFDAFVTLTATAAVDPGGSSAPSAQANYATGVTCSPNPPGALTVN